MGLSSSTNRSSTPLIMKAPMDESRDPRPVTKITKIIIWTPMSWYIAALHIFYCPDKRVDIGNLKPCVGMGKGPQSLKSVLVLQPQKAKHAKNTYILTLPTFFRPPAHLAFLMSLSLQPWLLRLAISRTRWRPFRVFYCGFAEYCPTFHFPLMDRRDISHV